jgi:putative ABC transport system permease protein
MAFVGFCVRRLRSRVYLNVLYLLSLILIIGIVVAIPIFADASGRGILEEELAARSKLLNSPPFALRFYGMPTSRVPTTLDDANYVRDWLADSLTRKIRLPIKTTYCQYESPALQLRPQAGDTRYATEHVSSVRVAYVPGIEEHIAVTEGAPFGVPSGQDALGVWLAASYARELGVQLGERFEMVYLLAGITNPVAVRIEGFFEATDPDDQYWYSDASTLFRGVFVTSHDAYNTYVAPLFPQGTGFNSWYFVFDDNRMNLDHADRYVTGIQDVELEFVRKIAGAKLDFAPTLELLHGQERKKSLSILMLGFSVPLLCILLLFMASISAIISRFQVRETAVLISRGSSRRDIMAWIGLESALLLALAIVPGILLGLYLARLLGNSAGFFSFVTRAIIHPRLTTTRWTWIALVGVFGVATRMIASWPGRQLTVVTHEHASVRVRVAVGGMRLLGILCLGVLTAYSYQQLEQTGTLFIGTWQAEGKVGFDPLVLLAPSLFLFSTPIIATELFTFVTRSMAFLCRPLPSLSAYLGFLHLGREGGQFRMPIYLLVLTLTSGIFYASIAKSADIWMVERRFYEVGADLTFKPDSSWGEGVGGGGALAGDVFMLPASEYETINGVANATRVAELVARVPSNEFREPLRLLAVDYSDFPQIAFYRQDFARHTLGELMAALARTPNGVLIPSSIANRLHLSERDRLPLRFTVLDTTVTFNFEVVGIYEYFPTMFEDDRPVVVTSLFYLEDQTLSFLPHKVWIQLQPDADVAAVLENMEKMQVVPAQASIARELVAQDREGIEHIGIFGILTTCFLFAALFSAMGRVVYVLAGMMRRGQQFAVLRAIGMKGAQVLSIVSIEDLTTICYGLVCGVGLGLLSAYLYVPFYAVTDRPVLPVPPFLPHIDWQGAINIVAVMALVLLVTQVAVLMHVRRTRLFEALRMGVRQ